VADLHQRVGTRLRALRHKAGFTQEGLAERSGLSYKLIGEIERGCANPTLATLGRLAGALAVDIVELVGPPSRDIYTFSAADVQRVREAITAVEDVIGDASPSRAGRRRR
jgi:transcriptional regulator with XRE-family HTH domain